MNLKYISTRGQAPVLSFEDAMLAGLAADGGLYVPEACPKIPVDEHNTLAGKTYLEIAERVIRPFVGEGVAARELEDVLSESYAQFHSPEVAPFKKLGEQLYVMELFHGPTLAFKDVALQFLGRMFDRVLNDRGERITIVGATSGDTGSAAIEACRDREAMDIFILHPEGRVSDVQRRQMTTVQSSNVHNIAVKGSFDDCQDLVKAMFNDGSFREEMKLSAINSINWARILAQVVYYVVASLRLGAVARPISFSVPTGNFGNVFAGYIAQSMELPIDKLIIGTNKNDILHRFLESGEMRQEGVEPTISPSMDIQISSNFERILFDLMGRQGDAVEKLLTHFREAGPFRLEDDMMDRMREIFSSARLDDVQTKEVISAIYQEAGYLVDPHTAVGLGAAKQCHDFSTGAPVVCLATAHPSKFPDAVKDATGVHPELPDWLSDLHDREERYDVLENDLTAVMSYVRSRIKDVR